jgi:hypothetical protein
MKGFVWAVFRNIQLLSVVHQAVVGFWDFMLKQSLEKKQIKGVHYFHLFGFSIKRNWLLV